MIHIGYVLQFNKLKKEYERENYIGIIYLSLLKKCAIVSLNVLFKYMIFNGKKKEIKGIFNFTHIAILVDGVISMKDQV